MDRKVLDELRANLRAARKDAQNARAEANTIRTEAKRSIQEINDRLDQSRAETAAVREDGNRRLEQAQRQSEEHRHEIAAARQETAAVREQAQRQFEEHRQEIAAARQETAVARQETAAVREQAQRQSEEHRHDIAAARQETAAVREQAQRQFEEHRQEIASARQETAAARTSDALAASRHEELLTEIRKLRELLNWKSRTSTRNPQKTDLTHEFIIMAGRKKHISNSKKVEHIPKFDPETRRARDRITTSQTPTLRDGEFIRMSVLSRQTRTAERAIREHEKNGEFLLQRGYMANGIDLRQNIKAAGKRTYSEVIDLAGNGKRRRRTLVN
ncbi:hypothetical protein PHYSODRAFT_362563 [Phytophthora sojae]|uniref:Uncharacterized protein n=1 Tax=Phytophthora sojae (strain P6497) TaxID=1094619 RepID=G5AGR0_PHYSP|nr:hypothetical protein PHYSODRAFT_362563 [Phytophthora sojae]EGZ05340.1 hypothetical protein PHYSODRAFT_362563 [Phytophthora sojae]|eukprot:XP_009539261.1 hypothetical protein PHYSODRAFT_362563 [Phytophthora sojae]